MSPQRDRGRLLACLLAALFLFAPASAQAPPEEEEEDPLADGLPDLDDSALPDLIGGNLNVHPQSPHEAQKTKLCADVRNIGKGDAVNSFDTIFLIDTIDEGSVRIQETLRSGHAVTICREFQIPAGRHQFTVRVDVSGGDRGEVLESDERNNQPTIRGFFVSSEPRPDLRFATVGVYPRVSEDRQPQAFSARIVNVGRLPSNATTLDIKDENGPIASGYPVPALQPGAYYDVNVLTRPEYRYSGNLTADYVLDPEGRILEEREDNNHAEIDYVVSPHPQPDLVVDRAHLNGTLMERRPLRIDARIENVGTRTMQQEGLAMLLARNESNVVHILANRTFPHLRPDAGLNLSFHFTLPPGNHTLRVLVDPWQREVELNETNNKWDANVTIAAPERVVKRPNLLVQALDAAPDDPLPHESVTLTALVANLGDETATDVLVEFRVDNRSIGRSTLRTLAPDQQMTVSVAWQPEGYREYALSAHVDPVNRTHEYVEDDNRLVRALVVRDPTASTAPPPPADPGDGGNDGTDGGGDEPPATDEPGSGTGGSTPPPAPPPSTPTIRPVEIADLRVGTDPQPGKLLGTIEVTLRNPNLNALSSMTVRFLIDGQLLKEVLVRDLPSAATRAVTSGEVELPSGKHSVSVEVRQVGQSETIRSQTDYDATALEKGVPAPGLVGALATVVAAAALVRRVQDEKKGRAR